MISNIKTVGGLEYVIWSKQRASDVYIIVTNGVDAFEAEINSNNKPTSILDLDDWNKKVLSSMQNSTFSKTHEYVVSLVPDAPSYFSVYEVFSAKTKLLLLKCELRRIPCGSNIMFHIFPHVTTELQSQRDKINDLVRENQFIMKQFSVLEHDMNIVSKYKDSMQSIILKQTCLLLNSKKREIVRLNSIISDMSKQSADVAAAAPGAKVEEPWEISLPSASSARAQRTSARSAGARAGAKKGAAGKALASSSLRSKRKRKLIGGWGSHFDCSE